MPTTKPVVLVVDDERGVADSYAHQIRDRYEPRVAYGGEEAIEQMDNEVAAVLLDRRMPETSGDEVLAELRELGYDCPIIMTTAVDPDLNILEMEFDDYLTKPISMDTLLDTLDQHLARQTSEDDPRLAEFFRLRSKLAVLEENHTRAELDRDEEYTRLKRRAESLEAALEDDVEDFRELYEIHRDIERGA